MNDCQVAFVFVFFVVASGLFTYCTLKKNGVNKENYGLFKRLVWMKYMRKTPKEFGMALYEYARANMDEKSGKFDLSMARNILHDELFSKASDEMVGILNSCGFSVTADINAVYTVNKD